MIRLAVVVACAAVVPAHVASADSCAGLVEEARAHHAAERYREALAATQRAHACEPQPGLLFVMGQLAFNLEDYPAAETFYARFLETNPEPDAAAVALQALAVTRERITAAKNRPLPPPPPPPPPRADRLAWSFAIGGGVASLVGGGLYFTARQRAVDLSGRYADYAGRVDGARDLRIGALACGGLGAALLVVATIRWGTSSDPSAPRSGVRTIVPLGGDLVGLAFAGEL